MFSCTVSEAPEFIDIDGYQVKKVNLSQVVVNADINFHNPNDVGCELVTTDIDVLANGVNVGKVTQLNAISIDDNSTFHIPTSISFSPKDVFGDTGGILNGALNALLSKEVKLEYKGSVTLSKAGIEFDIDVDDYSTIELKKTN